MHGVTDSREEFLRQKYYPIKSWKDWLQFELQHRDILAQQPQMPHRYVNGMKYEEWAHIFKQFEISSDTTLIGHSAGGGFLLRYLSENPNVFAQRLVLVAPWIDIGGIAGDFYKFKMDVNLISRIEHIDLFFSTDDDDDILESVKKIQETYKNISIYKSTDNGHFDNDAYPEILEILK